MVVVKNNVMYSCRVFYIGCDGLEEGKRRVEALQAPLRARYRGNPDLCEGEDMTITVTPDRIFCHPTDGSGAGMEMPLSTLSICAAVRCVMSASDPDSMKFVPVHSVITDHEPDTGHPAIFAAVICLAGSTELKCFAFICSETRDALHLVNATQTAHSTLQKGYSPSGAMKFFIDQKSEFDNTIRLQSTSSGDRRREGNKIYMYHEDYDSRDLKRATVRHHITSETGTSNVTNITKVYNDENVVLNGDESQTIYIKAGDYETPAPKAVPEPETIVIGINKEDVPRPSTPPAQQTIIIDQPVLEQPQPMEIPKPEIIQRKVLVPAPKPPKIEPQKFIVDVPVLEPFEYPQIPEPIIERRPVPVKLPPPPEQPRQRIVVDQLVFEGFPEWKAPPPPEIIENKIPLECPPYPEQKPPKIIVDTPYIDRIPTPPPCPPPIIEKQPVKISLPEWPKQEPYRVVVEQPYFEAPKEAPPCPKPNIEIKEVPVKPPPFPPQKPPTIIVERPVITRPDTPPPCPAPKIIEKEVRVPAPKWPTPKQQVIVVEKLVYDEIGPPPAPLPPKIIEKVVRVKPPPWPVPKQQTIVIERPQYEHSPAPPVPKPLIVEKPVPVKIPPPPAPPRQKVIVERPVYQTAYRTRTVPTGYVYERTVPAGYSTSYVVERSSSPRGLRRYAWSDAGNDARIAEQSAYRLYGQRRDFRQNQFMNERRFARSLNNEEHRYTVGPDRYTAGPGSYDGEYRRRSFDS